MRRLTAWLAAALAATLLGACDAPAGPTVEGTLTMPEALEAQLGESDTLFIVARPAGQKEGAPLAVKRFVGVSFPLDFSFDQQDVMVPGRTFEGELEIKASIHKSGLANVRVPGDMEGSYGRPVKPGAKDVDFAIDKVLEQMSETPDGRQYRIWIDPSGEVWVEDPDQGVLPLASALAPGFALGPAVAELPPPRLRLARAVPAPGPWPEDMAGLWALHDRLLTAAPVEGHQGPSLLDLKRAIAERLARSCVLCEHRCGVDRLAGERGRCKVGPVSYFQDAYVHVGEEREIAPSLCVPLTGCSWHCVYCHTYDLINRVDHGRALTPEVHPLLLERLSSPEVRTLSFVGGNPDHHLVSILGLLAAVPPEAIKPVVWNSNMYGSPELYRLLDGVVDVYLGDMRYGNDACAGRLSGLERCWEPVARNWQLVAEQEALLIVRLLLIPGHLDCCMAPMVAWLDAHLGQARISLMDQYHPTYMVAKRAPEIDRTPSREEVERARAMIRASGLSTVAEGPEA